MAIPSELEEKIKKFDENRNFKNSKPKHIELAEQEREKFVTAFPKEKFREIKLENYAPGKQPLDTNTWSYLNEFGSKNFGENGGGQADKFGVYMIGKEGPHKGKWEWAGRSLEKGTNSSGFETVEEAFKNSISVIGDCLDAAEDHIKINNWKK